MAVRSGAGTGVIVALVVFIITTVALLIISIAFYSGRADAIEARQEAERTLSQYVTAQERTQDVFQRFEDAARERNQSVARHLQHRNQNIMAYVDGDGSTTLERLQSRLVRYGVPDDGVVANSLQDMHRDLRRAQEQVTSLETRMAELTEERESLQQEMARLRETHQDDLASVQDQIAGYQIAADEYRDELNQTKGTMDATVDRLRNRYEERISELEDENDDLHRERVVLMDRVSDLQGRISADRIRAQDPAMLADGRIIDVAAGNTVYIDRGRQHRMVLGMTFEVYEDAGTIRVDDQTGQLRRGKASIQVVRVGESTSTAQIIRTVPGRPVVRDDVIANAVYDPDYQFKFLVHGYFDLDGDGRATDSERQYVERMIREWGGEVVGGTDLPGDLDFLVLGRPPQVPPDPPPGASDRRIQDWLDARDRREEYDRLFRQARDAQIPVLNHNRFLILTGHTQR